MTKVIRIVLNDYFAVAASLVLAIYAGIALNFGWSEPSAGRGWAWVALLAVWLVTWSLNIARRHLERRDGDSLTENTAQSQPTQMDN